MPAILIKQLAHCCLVYFVYMYLYVSVVVFFYRVVSRAQNTALNLIYPSTLGRVSFSCPGFRIGSPIDRHTFFTAAAHHHFVRDTI